MAVTQRNKKVFQSATANSHVNCQTKSLNKIPDHILTKLTNFCQRLQNGSSELYDY